VSQDDLILSGAIGHPALSENSKEQSHTSARGPVALRPFRDPVVVILLLAGTFDWLSGNPIHSVLLFAVCLGLGRNAVLGEPGAGREPTLGLHAHTRLSPVAVLGAVAYVVVVGGFGRYSWPATVAVVVPAATVLALVWRGPPHLRPAPGRLDPGGALAWASVFLALALWELTELLLQPSLTTDSHAHPTLSVLTDPVLATHPGRSVALLLWLGFGWFLVKR
jgi:hypothetical protein